MAMLFLKLLFEEIAKGEGLSFSEAAKVFVGRSGTPGCHPSAVWRWAKDGVKLRDGSRVKLESVRMGGRYLTSRGAIQRFLSACNEAEQTATATDGANSAAQRAAAELERIGA